MAKQLALSVALFAALAHAADTRYDRGVHMLNEKRWGQWRKDNSMVRSLLLRRRRRAALN